MSAADVSNVATLRPVTAIHYARGDATRPEGDGPKIIAHVCNDVGAWGRGFVLAVSHRWPEPEWCYRDWKERSRAGRDSGGIVNFVNDRHLEETGSFRLGESQLVGVAEGLFVLNMIAQEGIAPKRPTARGPLVRYDALSLCLRHAARFARRFGGSVHMPRIGCGLGGGSWDVIGPLIERLVDAPVTVYDLPEAV